MLKRFLAAAAGALSLALAGCASMYFSDAGPPPAPVRYELAELPFSEYWTGIVFNGEKIGFSHLAVRRVAAAPPRYEIRAEASFSLRFLGVEKKVVLRSRDLVREDLTLVEFDYRYHIDGSELELAGRHEAGELAARIVTGGKPSEQRLSAAGRVHPSSAIALYPVVHGLAPGRDYRYRVYSGELQALADVEQRVVGYQKSELFAGNAFKVETSMHGQSATTWFDHQGKPLLEIAMRGVMISGLEDEDSAKRYVALGALNKKESLVEFGLIRPDPPIDRPRRVSVLKVAVSGVDLVPPSGLAQRCVRSDGEAVCEIRGAVVESVDPKGDGLAAVRERYLQSSVTVQSRDPAIRRLAQEIAGGVAPEEGSARILRWLDANVERAPLDVFSALDVLEKRKAECQGHAYLYTALARAAGIPTRVVNGLAYSEDLNGFLYHSWAESLIGADWIAVDPTFGQTAADATHIKLVEGERLADLVPLLEWVGRARIRVLAVERGER
jgi:transglutaminase-like putative cysteine protease